MELEMLKRVDIKSIGINQISFVLLLFVISINSSYPSNSLIVIVSVTTLALSFLKSFSLSGFAKCLTLVAIFFLTLQWQFENDGGSIYGLSIEGRYQWILVLSPLLLACFFQNRAYILSGLRFLIILHVSLFYIQFVFMMIGINLDYLELLNIRESRTEVYLNFGNTFLNMRSSGLFHEPGTYASVLGTLVATVICIDRKFLSERIVIAFAITGFLSLSSFGMIAGFLCVFVYYYNHVRLFMTSKALVVLVFLLFLMATYFYYRFTLNSLASSGFGARFIIFGQYLNSSLFDFLFGQNLELRSISLNDYELYDFFIEDNGLLFYMLFIHGFVATFLFVFVLNKVFFVPMHFFLVCAFLKISLSFYFFSLCAIPALIVSLSGERRLLKYNSLKFQR
jgi:hypothetical protein